MKDMTLDDSNSKTRFIVVATARTGSNQLVNYINQTKVARCLGEIFKINYWSEPDNYEKKLITKCFAGPEEARKLHQLELGRYWETISHHLRGDHKYIGAKLFYRHRVHDDLWNNLLRRNSIIIHLWRNRILESFISLLRAETTGQWAIKDNSKLVNRNTRIVFDENRYLTYRRQSHRIFRRERSRLNKADRYYEIEYSRIADVAAIGGTLNSIFETQARLASTFVKQAPPDFLDCVENRSAAERYMSDRLDTKYSYPIKRA